MPPRATRSARLASSSLFRCELLISRPCQRPAPGPCTWRQFLGLASWAHGYRVRGKFQTRFAPFWATRGRSRVLELRSSVTKILILLIPPHHTAWIPRDTPSLPADPFEQASSTRVKRPRAFLMAWQCAVGGVRCGWNLLRARPLALEWPRSPNVMFIASHVGRGATL